MLSVYDELGGSAAILRLAEAWHERCLEDPVVSHAFSHPDLHPQHTERLAAYWSEALGGPAAYSGALADHSHVLRLHSGHGPHEDMDRRGELCFARAIDDAGVAGDAGVRARQVDWFHEMTVAMAAHPESADDVPAGLSIPVLGSEGLGD
jgi:hemoglobin